MGNVTSDLLVWTPDEDDLAEPDVYLATMAASMEDGLGTRLRKQERVASVLANVNANQNFVKGTPATANFTVNSGIGYNNGMTVTGGKIKVTEAGLYFFSANCLGAVGGTTGGGFMQQMIRKNGSIISNAITSLLFNGSSVVATTSGSTMTTCNVDDLIDVYITFYNTPAGTTPFLSAGSPATYNILSGALVKAS